MDGLRHDDAFGLLVQKFATPLLTLASTVLLARGLTTHDYGVYGLFQGTVKYVALFTSLGTPFVVVDAKVDEQTRRLMNAANNRQRMRGIQNRARFEVVVIVPSRNHWLWRRLPIEEAHS